jgi:glycosyltransferase involved in cell wall biosynthesis
VKVVHLIQRYEPALGGSETWCRAMARHQARCGHRVRVLTLDIIREQEFWEEPPPERRHYRLGRLDLDQGVEVRRFRRSLPAWTVHHLLLRGVLDRLLNVFFLGPHSREMMTHLASEMEWADIVHLHTLPYPHNGLGLRTARRLQKKVVMTPHFHPGHPDYERPHQYRWLARADAVLAVSGPEKDALAQRGVPAARITVTGNGYSGKFADEDERARHHRELRARLGLPSEARVVACVARKTPEKGIETVVRAVGRLLEEDRPIALVLAGPSFPWFEDLLQSLPPAHRARVFDLGVVSDDEKFAMLAGADLFALPSRYEAFGIVFLEAWAAGLPVVGGADGAQPAVIGKGGQTVPFGDVEATAHALASFLDDAPAATAAVAWGRKAIRERYSWERLGNIVLDVYRKIDSRSGLRIAVGSNFYPPAVEGGAELALAHQAEGLAKRGHSIEVLAGRLDERGERHAVSREPGTIPVTRLNLYREDLSAEFDNHINPAADLAFARLLDRYAPDVVHLHNLAGLSASMIHEAADRGLPVVMTLHDYWGLCARNTLVRGDGSLCSGPGAACARCLPPLGQDPPRPAPVRNAEVMAALGRVSLFLCPSRYLAWRFIETGIPPERIRVLPNGLDLRRFARSTPDEVLGRPLLYLGYLGPHKGLPVLLEALARPGCREIRLRVAGDGEQRDEYRELSRTLGLERRVEFLGAVPPRDVPALLSGAGALVVPSVWPENAPVSITEAMASARPVVASDMGGIPELVEHGRTGFLFAPGDAEALASALRELNEQPERAAVMGRAARRAAARLEREKILEQLEGIYSQLRDRPVAAPFSPPLPVLALAGDDGEWIDTDLYDLLQAAEEVAGPFSTVAWRNLREPDPRCGPVSAGAVVLTGTNALGVAGEAMSLGVPFVGVAQDGSGLSRLAKDSGAGRTAGDPAAAGRLLASILVDDASQRRMSAAGERFLDQLAHARPTTLPRAPQADASEPGSSS